MKTLKNIATASLLLIIAVLPLRGLDTESLWYDEAWTVYAVSGPPPATFEPPRGTRAQLTAPARAALDDLLTTLALVRGDVHPPLYFLLLDAWTFAAGESVFALRYLSLLMGLIGAAALYTLARTVFTSLTGLYALALYGTGMLFVHYSQEARMYTLLMTLAIAATLAYMRLLRRPTWARAMLYALLAALGLYTHYTMALVLLSHGLHAIWGRARWAWLGAMAGAGVLFLPYAPVVVNQLGAGGALAEPLPTNLATLAALGLLLTGGWGWLYGAVLVAAGVGAYRWRGRGLGWLLPWMFLTPGVLLLLNAVWMPLYQVRYVLAALPAVALLLAFGLNTLPRWAGALVAGGLIAAQLNTADSLLPPKPNYAGAVARAAAVREPLEPIITDMAPRDPMRYHGAALTQGLTLNLSWRGHHADEIEAIAARLAGTPSVWVVIPVNVAKTWHTMDALAAQGRTVSYADHVQNMVIYRMDAAPGGEPLRYTFGELAAYTLDIMTVQAAPGELICVPLALDVLEAGDYSLSLTLVQGYDTIMGQWNGPLTADQACFENALSPGEYHIYATVVNAAGERVPVMQGEVWWGWWAVTHRVVVVQS